MLACSRVTYRAPRGSSDANRRMMVLVRPDQEASVLSSLSAEERSVLLTELLRAYPELRAEAETITTTLLRACSALGSIPSGHCSASASTAC